MSSGIFHCCSGCYPLFKPGVDSQGGQTLHVEIQRSELENISQDLEESTTIEVLVSLSFS